MPETFALLSYFNFVFTLFGAVVLRNLFPSLELSLYSRTALSKHILSWNVVHKRESKAKELQKKDFDRIKQQKPSQPVE